MVAPLVAAGIRAAAVYVGSKVAKKILPSVLKAGRNAAGAIVRDPIGVTKKAVGTIAITGLVSGAGGAFKVARNIFKGSEKVGEVVSGKEDISSLTGKDVSPVAGAIGGTAVGLGAGLLIPPIIKTFRGTFDKLPDSPMLDNQPNAPQQTEMGENPLVSDVPVPRQTEAQKSGGVARKKKKSKNRAAPSIVVRNTNLINIKNSNKAYGFVK